ncbi:MAG: FAD binding domain-containing protein [Elusimicrobiales bacterium]|nr:FAD binding domain-containing protein [Elusimicrobiales bacterium]
MSEIIFKPCSLEEMWAEMPNLPESRKYMAGGTDVVTVENAGFPSAECWIDISDIPELAIIKEEKDHIFIGAGVKLNELENYPFIKKYCPALIAAVHDFASPSLRNMATLGGNAGNASPCADGVCALVAEQAAILLRKGSVERKMPLKDFFTGPKRTKLAKDELIYGFEVPKKENLKGTYYKLGPRAFFGISKVAVALSAEMEGNKIRRAYVAIASVAPVPLYAAKTSEYLTGKELTEETIKQAAEIATGEVSPITDARSEADYRRAMSGVLLERALREVRS